MNSEYIKPSLVSVCSGWGGGDEGAKLANYETLLALDNNKHARQNYRLNHPGVDVQGWDVMKVDGHLLLKYLRKEPLEIDFFFPTPNCTGISRAGKNDPLNEANLLFLHIIRNIIPSLQSKTFLIETVDNLPHGNMRVLYDIVRKELDKLTGYSWDIKVCNSLHYKTPTTRNRCFIMGVHDSLGTQPSWPEPDLEYANNLRILNIVPEIDGLLYGYGFDKLKSKFDFANTFTKTLNLKGAKDGKIIPLTIDQVLKFCGYPPNWKYTGSYEQVWARAGNSVMPPMAYALAKHIRENILSIPVVNINTK